MTDAELAEWDRYWTLKSIGDGLVNRMPAAARLGNLVKAEELRKEFQSVYDEFMSLSTKLFSKEKQP